MEKYKIKNINNLKYIAILILLSGSFISCGKTHCPAFPEHLTGYMPYKQGDTLLFINQHDDSLSLFAGVIEKTEEWSYGFNCKCDCGAPYAFFSSTDLQSKFSLRWTISAGDKYKKPFICFELDNCYWGLETLESSYLYFYEESGKDPFNPKNSALFGETVILENDKQQISRVTAENGIGITGFYDQIQNLNWESIK